MLLRALRLAALSVLAASSAGCALVSLVARGGPSLSDVDRFPSSRIEAASHPSPLTSSTQCLPPERLRWVVDGAVYEGTWDEILRTSRTRALLVARGASIELEWYDRPSTAQEPLLGLSITKPVVSLLLAQAVASGAVNDLDDPVTRYLPALARRDARWREVSLRALDDMRAVLAGPGDRDAPIGVAARLYVSSDLAGHLLTLLPEPLGADRVSYHSAATQLIAAALEAAAGQSIEQLLAAGVWQPIGAEAGARWGRDRLDGGMAKAFCCLAAVPRDWLRLGQQFVVPHDDGAIVPATLRDRLRTASLQDRYRAGWWIQPSIRDAGGTEARRACLASTSRRAAVGWLGQTLIVDPDQGWVALRIGEAGDWRHWPLLTTLLACDVLEPAAAQSGNVAR